jgi:hypothetical protein
MENFKMYVDTDKESVKIKFSISYLKPSESRNWATSEYRETGYRVNAVPVERSADGRMESFTAFTGFGDTLLPCKRRSQKRYEQAQEILMEKLPSYLQWFINKGYKIPEEVRKSIMEQYKIKLGV